MIRVLVVYPSLTNVVNDGTVTFVLSTPFSTAEISKSYFVLATSAVSATGEAPDASFSAPL